MAYTYGNWDLERRRLPQNNGIGMQLPRWDTPAPVGGDDVGMQMPVQRLSPPQASKIGGVVDTAAKVASPWPNIGFQAVGGVLNWLGDSYGRKQRRQGMERLNSMYGKNVLDVPGLTSLRQRAIYANASRLAPSIDQRYGFNQGRAAGALYEGLVGDTANAEADAYYQNALETARRNMEIAQAGANYGR